MSSLTLAIISIIFGISPIAIALLATSIASYKKCRLDGSDPCIVFGKDISGLLGSMVIMHWFAMFTFPIGVIGVVISVIRAIWY